MLGIVFIISAYSKFISPGIIEIILTDQGIASTRQTAGVIVRLLIGFEFALGVLFFQRFYLKKIVLPLTFFFLVTFSLYLGYTGLVLKETQNCGCFGTLIQMSPVESIFKNIVLLVLSVILYKFLGEDKKNKFVIPAVVFVSVAAIFISLPIKSLNDFKFSKYSSFEGSGRVDLSEGDKLIAILDPDCDHCQNLAKDITKLRRTMKWVPEIYALFLDEGTVSVDSFKAMTQSNFPYRKIKVNEFFDLIGKTPPRIYWIQNGRIKEIWDNNFISNIAKKFFERNSEKIILKLYK